MDFDYLENDPMNEWMVLPRQIRQILRIIFIFIVCIFVQNTYINVNLSRHISHLAESINISDQIQLLVTQINQTLENITPSTVEVSRLQYGLMSRLKQDMYASYVDTVDYACALHGGRVVKEEASLISSEHNASHLLAGEIQEPGQCWAFQNQAKVTIKLYHPICVKAVTYEHIAIDMVPDAVALQSAPKHFNIAVLSNLTAEPHDMGRFSYNWKNKASQRFVLASVSDNPTSYLIFSVKDNFGNKQYTCAYRLRVHGIPCDESECVSQVDQ